MANEQNLIPNSLRTPSEVRRNSSKGGKMSGKVRREKKVIRTILAELLDGTAKDSKQFAGIAKKLGIESDKSVKELFTLVCVMNTLKKGDLSDLEQLTALLGEETKAVDNSAQTDLLDAIEKAVKNGKK